MRQRRGLAKGHNEATARAAFITQGNGLMRDQMDFLVGTPVNRGA